MKILPQLLQQVKDDQWEKLEVVYCGLINYNIFGEMYCFVLPKQEMPSSSKGASLCFNSSSVISPFIFDVEF